MDWRATTFRGRMVHVLHDECGLGYREADRLLKTLVDCLTRAVRRGEVVELPGIGTIKGRIVKAGRTRLKRSKLVQGTFYRLITPKDQRKIYFRQDPDWKIP